MITLKYVQPSIDLTVEEQIALNMAWLEATLKQEAETK